MCVRAEVQLPLTLDSVDAAGPREANPSGGKHLRGCIPPKLLQLVKIPGERVKDVDHKIHEIHENPPSSVEPLHMEWAETIFGKTFQDVFGDGPNLDIGIPSGQHEKEHADQPERLHIGR